MAQRIWGWALPPCLECCALQAPFLWLCLSGKGLPACHLCPIPCWGSSEQDTSGLISCWILIASLELKPLAFLGEPALPGSSEPLPLPLAGLLEHSDMQVGGKTAQHLASPCSSRECCPLNPCSELPQHEDSKETQALLMCPSFSM